MHGLKGSSINSISRSPNSYKDPVEPILDEVSLVPCSDRTPAARLHLLAATLQALDQLGAPRILRSVRDAADRDIGAGRGLRSWCFDKTVDEVARRLVASRLGKQPFIDGAEGLFTLAEGQRAIEATVRGVPVFGCGLAALNGGLVIALGSATMSTGAKVTVDLLYLDADGESKETVEVLCLIEPTEVDTSRDTIIAKVDEAVSDGSVLVARAPEMFPKLRFGTLARDQIAALVGTEPIFRQLLRHLRALDLGARDWKPETPFAPSGALPWSVESKSTLEDGKLGPMRDFPVPEGFVVERWSLHTKLTGGAGSRLYFRAERNGDNAVVLIGYFGDHLPTVKYRT